MANTRNGRDSHEGPRATPEDRWSGDAQAERRMDALTEHGIPPRESAPGRQGKGDEELPEGMRKALRDQEERIADQARKGPRAASDPEQPK
jgi:hypothetical protein